VEVAVECSGATRSVVYGNVGAGTAEACKVYDRDGDGNWDEGEPTVPGFLFEVCGTDVTGASVALAQATGEDGCTTFDLLPGTYGIAEILPDGSWEPTGDSAAVKPIVIESILDPSGAIGGTTVAVVFTNVCKGTADFGTKGYWHNKNGLEEITPADLAYVNGLNPYDSPTDYFGAGDEPFDGFFMDGTPVDAAEGDWGEEVAPAGSPKAEVSHFLVDANAGGDPREQLAQQLLAFIFNCRHRLDSPGAAIKLPDGAWASAGSLIDAAIAAWMSQTTDDDKFWEPILDALNNNDYVPVIQYYPCPVVY
jgi:hypothetical protein